MDVKNLEDRLKLYRALQPLQGHVRRLWEKNNVLYSRPLFAHRPSFFDPPKELSPEKLGQALERLVALMRALLPETQTIKRTFISIEDTVKELLSRMTGGGTTLRFREITKEHSKQEIIATFLAILHLFYQQLVAVEQEGHFSDIVITKQGGSPTEATRP